MLEETDAGFYLFVATRAAVFRASTGGFGSFRRVDFLDMERELSFGGEDRGAENAASLLGEVVRAVLGFFFQCVKVGEAETAEVFVETVFGGEVGLEGFGWHFLRADLGGRLVYAMDERHYSRCM